MLHIKAQEKKTERYKEMTQEEDLNNLHLSETYISYSKELLEIKHKNLSFLESCRKKNKTVFGMGAPVKGNTLLNFFDIDSNLISKLVEINPLRKGLFSPGSHLEVVMENELSNPPDVFYVLAWNFKEEILKNNYELIKGGTEFYFPVEVKN